MSHFMIAHLQNGRYNDVQILKPETAVQMHTRQSGWPSTMNAQCLQASQSRAMAVASLATPVTPKSFTAICI